MTRRNFRALVVNFCAGDRESLVIALVKAGIECDQAEDGHAALDKVKSVDYDVVVTSLRMPRPKMHGHQLAIELLKLHNRPRVVILTAITDSRILQDLLRRGVEDVLIKTSGDDDFVAAKIHFLMQKQRFDRGRDHTDSDGRAELSQTDENTSDKHPEQGAGPDDTDDLSQTQQRQDDDYEKLRWSQREENNDVIGMLLYDGKKVIPPSDAFREVTTKDISATGIGFYCSEPLVLSQALILKLGTAEEPEYFLAEVVHCEERQEQFVVGCRFTGLCDKWV